MTTDMKFLVIFMVSMSYAVCSNAQSMDASGKRTDSIAKKVIQFFKIKQPDSVYAMTGKAFREKITAENFAAITTTQILPMNNFEKVSFMNHTEGINKYKVDGTPPLQLMISLDIENKIETLLVQPYVDNK